MLATDISEAQENYDSKIKKILSKTIKKKKVLEDYINIIYNIISVGFDYKERIKETLK